MKPRAYLVKILPHGSAFSMAVRSNRITPPPSWPRKKSTGRWWAGHRSTLSRSPRSFAITTESRDLQFPANRHDVRTDAEHGGFVFDFTNHRKQPLALDRITPQTIEIAGQPTRPFNG